MVALPSTNPAKEPMQPKPADTRPEWARNTLHPKCPACGNYVLPCTATPTGIHPK